MGAGRETTIYWGTPRHFIRGHSLRGQRRGEARKSWEQDGIGCVEMAPGRILKVDIADLAIATEFRWNLSAAGYAHRYHTPSSGKRQGIHLHRVLANATPGLMVDHINGDRLDNRRCNLRLCDTYGNARNTARSAKGSSRYKGVSWYRNYGKWMAQITVNYKRKFIGYYANEEDAARAYNEAAREHFGEFARLNDVEPVCV